MPGQQAAYVQTCILELWCSTWFLNAIVWVSVACLLLAGVRPLHLGAQSGNARVVQLLLDAPGIVVDTRADEARWASNVLLQCASMASSGLMFWPVRSYQQCVGFPASWIFMAY
jgi:hypothetical protein